MTNRKLFNVPPFLRGTEQRRAPSMPRLASACPRRGYHTPAQGNYVFSVVGTSRCDVPARVQRAERISQHERATAGVAPLDAARTAQRAVPTTVGAPVIYFLKERTWATSPLISSSLNLSANGFIFSLPPSLSPS